MQTVVEIAKFPFSLETSGGLNSHLYSNVVHFLTLVLIRNLWQPKTVVFLHGCMGVYMLFYRTIEIEL
jgi:hypothetical protein